MIDFLDKVVMIAGASGNLGRAVAGAFQSAGAKSVLVDRSQEHLESTYPELVSSADHYLAGGVDLTDQASVIGLLDETIRRFDRVDVLVNTVGGFRAGKPVHEDDPDNWSFLFKLNVLTTLLTSQAVAPHMIAQKSGVIVNVASKDGLEGSANAAGYSATKSGVIRLSEAMAEEVKPSGVHVHCILPATMDTPQNRNAMPDADFSQWVEPASVADVILFLASDLARSLYGVVLPVYGREKRA
jgi:NAD(P)-dependent dehydrogenase (short-subunit alcohol dehydrogenase family)